MALHAIPIPSYDDPSCLSIFRFEVRTKNNGEKKTDGVESGFDSIQRLPSALQHFFVLYRNPLSEQHTFVFHVQLQKYRSESEISEFSKSILFSLLVCFYLLKTFQLSNAAWWYFFSKIVELLDTVFFVLRKKQSQVTFLHVYHHTITMGFSWVYLKFIPGMYFMII